MTGQTEGADGLLKENEALRGRIRELEAEVSSLERDPGALKVSESEFDAFAPRSHMIVFMGDLDFKPIFFKGAIESITGYEEQAFVRGELKWSDIIHPADRDDIMQSDLGRMHTVSGFSSAGSRPLTPGASTTACG